MDTSTGPIPIIEAESGDTHGQSPNEVGAALIEEPATEWVHSDPEVPGAENVVLHGGPNTTPRWHMRFSIPSDVTPDERTRSRLAIIMVLGVIGLEAGFVFAGIPADAHVVPTTAFIAALGVVIKYYFSPKPPKEKHPRKR